MCRTPNAFLISSIFDYRIPFWKAWEVPFKLQQRLGHIDVASRTSTRLSMVAGKESLCIGSIQHCRGRYSRRARDLSTNTMAQQQTFGQIAHPHSKSWRGCRNLAMGEGSPNDS